jgi:hypothetical protein
MTDEQLLLYYFGMDIGTKGVQAFMLKKTATGIIDSLKENTMAIREQNAYQTRPKTQEQEVKYEPKEETPVTEEYSENISQVVQEEAPRPKRKKPATNLDSQVEFFEPEEVQDGVYSILNDRGGFKEEKVVADNMPTFGDPEILAGIEKIAKENDLEKPTRKKRVTTKRKPRK